MGSFSDLMLDGWSIAIKLFQHSWEVLFAGLDVVGCCSYYFCTTQFACSSWLMLMDSLACYFGAVCVLID